MRDREEGTAMGCCGHGIKHPRLSNQAAVFALSLMLAAGAAFTSGCGEKEVSLEYDPQPGLAIVTVESGGGLPFPGDDLLPAFQLFGDGTIIAFREEPSGQSLYVQGKLDEAGMADLLGKITDTGFFDLKDEYVDPDVYDATYRTIALDLVETDKAVTVDMLNDVPEFDEAYDLILDYPVGEVNAYVPVQGYLVVVKYPLESMEDTEYMDPDRDIFKLLPAIDTLYKAAADHVAIAVDGAAFIQLKKYDSEQESRGINISRPDSIIVIYPVYEPRSAKKP